jgi:hypothetical protein
MHRKGTFSMQEAGAVMAKRLTVEFTEKAANALDKLAEEEEATKVEILRRSLMLYEYILKQVRDGKKVVIVDKDNRQEKELVLQ